MSIRGARRCPRLGGRGCGGLTGEGHARERDRSDRCDEYSQVCGTPSMHSTLLFTADQHLLKIRPNTTVSAPFPADLFKMAQLGTGQSLFRSAECFPLQ